MYLWYKEAQVCYAYLSDVSLDPGIRGPMNSFIPHTFTPAKAAHRAQSNFTESLWFTRGWTLQELIAPENVLFYDRSWTIIGSKHGLASEIESRTNIDAQVLQDRKLIQQKLVAVRMSWAATRQTTRIEDQAYCLLGLFNVNMPLLYGEREKSFQRLLKEIAASSNDASIFAASTWVYGSHEIQMFPTSPHCFYDSKLYKSLQLFPSDRYDIHKGQITLIRPLILHYKLDYFIWVIAMVQRPYLRDVVGIPLQLTRGPGSKVPVYRRVILDDRPLFQSWFPYGSLTTSQRTSDDSATIETLHQPRACSSTQFRLQPYSMESLACPQRSQPSFLECSPAIISHTARNGHAEERSYPPGGLICPSSGRCWLIEHGREEYCLILAHPTFISAEGGQISLLLCIEFNPFEELVCRIKKLKTLAQDSTRNDGYHTECVMVDGDVTIQLLANAQRRHSDAFSHHGKFDANQREQCRLLANDFVDDDNLIDWSKFTPQSIFSIEDWFKLRIFRYGQSYNSLRSTYMITLDFLQSYDGAGVIPRVWHQSCRSSQKFRPGSNEKSCLQRGSEELEMYYAPLSREPLSDREPLCDPEPVLWSKYQAFIHLSVSDSDKQCDHNHFYDRWIQNHLRSCASPDHFLEVAKCFLR